MGEQPPIRVCYFGREADLPTLRGKACIEPVVINAAVSTNNRDAPSPCRSKRTTVFPKADIADGHPQAFNDPYQPLRLRPPAA